MSDKHYLKGKDFHAEYELSQIQGKPTDKLLKMFELIAIKYSSKFNNLCDLDKNSCINFATMEAYTKWHKYDRTQSENIFSFFTEMIKNDLTASYNLLHKKSRKNISLDVLFSNNHN